MRILLVSVAVAAMAAGSASAQIGSYRPYSSQPLPTYKPRTTTTYDYQSGNSYTTTVKPNGGARVQGYNYNNGSSWNTDIDQRGNMRGQDANGNYWNYNARSKSYYNYGTGVSCYGEGQARVCY